MQKELNHKVRKCFNEGIYNVARYTEIVLSIIILIVIALAGIRLIFTITEIQIMDMDIDFFTTFLANAAFNKFINFVVNNIDIVLSIGGLVSGFLDILVGDKKLNNKICTIKLW